MSTTITRPTFSSTDLDVRLATPTLESVEDRLMADAAEVACASPTGSALAFKHAAGRTLAALAMLILVPVLLAIALAVKLSSSGTVLYRQRRIGQDGREFDILKFRSMRGNGNATEFMPADGSAPGGVEGVDRRTLVGRFIRRTSLDELPQLWNVVRGDMALVGPRPERPEFVSFYSEKIPGYADRHIVRPGITGLAQVRGFRGKTSIAHRAAADLEYISRWSLALDLWVLLLTVRAVWQPAE